MFSRSVQSSEYVIADFPRAGGWGITRLGVGLIIPVVLLLLVGLVCIHATDRVTPVTPAAVSDEPKFTQSSWVERAYDWLGANTRRQLLFFLTGIVLLGLTLLPSYHRIGRWTYVIYSVSIAMLSLLIIDRYIVDIHDSIVPIRRETRRWITFGNLIGIQPSEFMKVALVLVLARYLRYRDSYRSWPGLIPPFLLTLLPMVLILKQPDLGTLLMLLPVLFCMLFVAGARIRHLATIVLLGCAVLPVFYFVGMAPYQRERIQVMFKQNIDSEAWHMDQGYQLRQAKIALGTGGVLGEGYGQGVFLESRLALLPEEHNDFIFSIIGHQFGLVGCCFVMLCYAAIVLFGVEIAAATNDPFGRLLAVGVIVMIVVQALLNMCMNIGLAPITGMPLPFVSAGGSSLWANFLALGLLLNVAKRRPMFIANPPFEHHDD
ncbi:MAG: FtsW/RodA/SpoVE family cell cycle protein [Phycisphaerae bacterium]